jgi:hypothetical protein
MLLSFQFNFIHLQLLINKANYQVSGDTGE